MKTLQLEIFKFNAGDHFDNIRTIDRNGEIWFVGSDVTKILGYSNGREAIQRHCRQGGVAKHDIPTSSGLQNMTIINEPNVYRLIARSTLPSAEKFESWIFDEVIPAIRKTGGYHINRNQTSNFILRYFENATKIPNEYFSVITELYVRLYGKLESLGYVIPDKGFMGKEIRPDTSVGICFAAHLKKNYPSAPDEFKKYIHRFPTTGFECEARLYSIELWPIFIKYIYDVWIPEKAEEYFSSRDRMALTYIQKLLPDYHG
jgi:prophage antirepressor-like protein